MHSNSTKLPPPSPSHVLRVHAANVNTVEFSSDNERLYSADVSGTVVITSTRTLRPIASWKAHTDSVLRVQEWDTNIITHGRDNKLHVWARVASIPSVGDAAQSPDLPTPELRYSLDVNALNFCAFSLHDAGQNALIAVPNLIESSVADIWLLPSCTRLHAAVGKVDAPEIGMKSWEPESDGRGNAKTGILMALHLFRKSDDLHLLSAYESGEVALRRCVAATDKTIEGIGWERLWITKLHVESVMSMAVSHDCSFALTVSADHIIGQYKLFECEGEQFTKQRTKHAGNGGIKLRSDGRVCVVGGWDGKVRLFSTKSFKSLGTLSYHTKSCPALAFAHSKPTPNSTVENIEEDDEWTDEEKERRSRWLATGSQDNRISIWQLMDFSSSK
ncbi:WD-40 repeat-containing [Pyrrhoderma noxium]|uniref:ASTRA-associated protein 1 n=1 Tax=Pyrrhoderma noxium TaxID=2282107 RepID=A0A286U9L4_9AGAM|nr:WD-40 repeat-containing [Pyrrhoderma noxium]